MGVEIHLNRGLAKMEAQSVLTNCTYTDQLTRLDADAVVIVGSRLPEDRLYQALKAREDEWADAGVRSVSLIGDANAPGPIAWATYAGHRYARELDGENIGDALPFKREIAELID